MKIAIAALALMACSKREEPKPREHEGSGRGSAVQVAAPGSGSAPGGVAAPAVKHDGVARTDFNRFAVRQNLPIYWIADRNNDRSIDPDEVAPLLFYSTSGNYVANGAFTGEFETAYKQIADAVKAGDSKDKRIALVQQDLDQGRATLVLGDLSALDADDKAFVAIMLDVAKQIDELYGLQNGAAAIASKVAADPESQSLFRRNFGPKCVAPKTENDPACSSTADGSRATVSIYPPAITAKPQSDPAFCATLEKLGNATELVTPFTIVKDAGDGKYAAVPYTEAFKAQMEGVSAKLAAASAKLATKPNEAPLKAYLDAASTAFTTNNWDPADEAWAKMSVDNSAWYVRVAPDEVYWEPCSHKAGFHLTFARINQASKDWQGKLTPVLQDMEKLVAGLAGPPYAERQVKVHLPDFIDILTNSGDDRNPLGATIGQSLPNFGPVANGGRGRTVAMVNLYTDPDSIAARRRQVESLFDASSAKTFTGTAAPGLLDTILHEATHNLGPAHEYEVGGKKAPLVFGGSTASMLEELKAQTGALVLTEFVRGKGLLPSADFATAVYTDAIVWACGHISEGMREGGAAKKLKPYPALAAIQVGFLMDHGAITFDKAAKSADGKETGALVLHPEKFVAATTELMKLVAGIKARGDTKGAEALIAKYVDSSAVVPHAVIAERWLREPKASFVYSVKL